MDSSAGAGEPPYAERVLDAVAAIPPGRVMSYGDVADYVGAGTGRMVGRVLARSGGDVHWHRVVMATGDPAPHKAAVQLALLCGEGVPLTPDGRRVDMTRARWDGR